MHRNSQGLFACFYVHRYQFYDKTWVIWNIAENGTWQEQRALGDMPLVPGDSFNMTGHLRSDSLTLLLNEAHVYTIPLARAQDGVDGIDVSESTVLALTDKVHLSYVNLISGC